MDTLCRTAGQWERRNWCHVIIKSSAGRSDAPDLASVILAIAPASVAHRSGNHCDGRPICASSYDLSFQCDAVALSHAPAAPSSRVSNRWPVTGSRCTGQTTPRRSSCRRVIVCKYNYFYFFIFRYRWSLMLGARRHRYATLRGVLGRHKPSPRCF
ncbi:hypothetical protein LZ32DRAFT_152246 [Colletotrichum eremochloae]|nr:hypothetical protein LZ32DRAFT_152246 [Colletotrichum eremochloae]